MNDVKRDYKVHCKLLEVKYILYLYSDCHLNELFSREGELVRNVPKRFVHAGSIRVMLESKHRRYS